MYLNTDNQVQPSMDNNCTLETEIDHSQQHILSNEMNRKCTKRTEMKNLDKKDIQIPDGFPSGPWISFEEAKNTIQKWAFDFHFGGGWFKVVLGSLKRANSARGIKED